MTLPLDRLAKTYDIGELLSPDSIYRRNKLIDYELGGIALQDPTSGLEYQEWTLELVGNDVTIYPSSSPGSSQVLFTATGINQVSLAFDQNMRPVVAYVAHGQAKLWWYDTVPQQVVTTTLDPDVRSPVVSLDDKRQSAFSRSDVLLFYCRGPQLMYRQQRDRYNTERLLKSFPGNQISIRRAGMSTRWRMQIEVVGSDNYDDKPIAYPAAWTGASYLASVTSIAKSLPDGIEDNDLVLAFLMTRATVTPAGGWTYLDDITCTDGTVTQRLSLYSKTTVSSSDSGTSHTWQQSSSERMGVAYVVARLSTGFMPAVLETLKTHVDSQSTMSISPPVATAVSYQELVVLAATSIVGTADVEPAVAPAFSSLRSEAVSQTRLGVSIRHRFARHKTAGQFTFPAPIALNGLAAMTVRIGFGD